MSLLKISVLITWLVSLVLLVAFTGTAALVGKWLLIAMAIGHALEMLLFSKLCRDAEGSTVSHLLQVFVFGLFHAQELKEQAAQ